ncbi:FecR family protein [Pedobacter glucosidilyticus]|uniref:FecR family protein n=1 Tax=Pedobacter glucosidilyticus TaxID=1122941 RepID=UPI0026EF0978|nr:FecR family protein [Pedobacter glucosidilyticus]
MNKLDGNLLSKIITGEASPAEKEEFYNTLQNSQEAETDFYETKSLWLKMGSQYQTENVDAAFEETWRLIQRNNKPTIFQMVRRSLKYAAIFFTILSLGVVLGYLLVKNTINYPDQGIHKFSSLKGSLSTIELPDGTKVWLNAGTELTYKEDLENKQRLAELKGEAYFEVKHREDFPLLVKVGKVTVRDLGTTFNIKAYSSESVVTSLIEGKADILSEKGNILTALSPGQTATYSHKTGRIVLSSLNESTVNAWRNQKFVLTDERLEDIFKELSIWYDVEFEFEDEKIKDARYSLSVKKETSLVKVLEMLRLTTSFNYEIQNKVGQPDKITIY